MSKLYLLQLPIGYAVIYTKLSDVVTLVLYITTLKVTFPYVSTAEDKSFVYNCRNVQLLASLSLHQTTYKYYCFTNYF